jgi:hypothetical protein
MPPRTTRKSDRPRASDRTMVGTAQPLCLSASGTIGRRYESTMNLRKRETHGVSSQYWGWTATPFLLRCAADGEAFVLTSPFIERRYRNVALWCQIHASSTWLDRKKFYAASLLSHRNSYFSIIVAMPADSPGFITHRWIRPWHRTLTGEPRVICVGIVISTSTAVPVGIASGKKK